MSTIFKNKKKRMETSLELTECKRELARTQKRLENVTQDYDELLAFIKQYNRSLATILTCQSIRGYQLVVVVECRLNYRQQVTSLEFSLYDILGVRPMGVLWVDISYCDEEKGYCLKHLTIRDFIIYSVHNQGYGSFLMTEALDYIASLFGRHVTIRGWLSPVDEEKEGSGPLRNHFYQKFGFTIMDRSLSLTGISLKILRKERLKWTSTK